MFFITSNVSFLYFQLEESVSWEGGEEPINE